VDEFRRHRKQPVQSSSRARELSVRSPAATEGTRPVLATAVAESRPFSHATSHTLGETKHGPDEAATGDPRRAYTVNETRRIIPVSRSTIYKLLKNNSLVGIKLCGRLLITRDSIEELLAGKAR
jgi:hypothetical protein